MNPWRHLGTSLLTLPPSHPHTYNPPKVLALQGKISIQGENWGAKSLMAFRLPPLVLGRNDDPLGSSLLTVCKLAVTHDSFHFLAQRNIGLAHLLFCSTRILTTARKWFAASIHALLIFLFLRSRTLASEIASVTKDDATSLITTILSRFHAGSFRHQAESPPASVGLYYLDTFLKAQ